MKANCIYSPTDPVRAVWAVTLPLLPLPRDSGKVLLMQSIEFHLYITNIDGLVMPEVFVELFGDLESGKLNKRMFTRISREAK